MAGLSLSAEHVAVLERFEHDLLQMAPNCISAWLYGKEALTDSEKKAIDACTSVKKKNQRLLQFARQDTVSFFLFLEALEKNDHKQLAKRVYQDLLPSNRPPGHRRSSSGTMRQPEPPFRAKGPQQTKSTPAQSPHDEDVDAVTREAVQTAMSSISPSGIGVTVLELEKIIRKVVQEERDKQQALNDDRIRMIVRKELRKQGQCCPVS